MKKYFDEECNVFTADDPGLTRLEEALLDLDYKVDLTIWSLEVERCKSEG